MTIYSNYVISSNVEFDVSAIETVRDAYCDHIFLPDLSLAIEYNGEYHYRSIPMHPSSIHDLVSSADTMILR